ncbi:hypothetical protein DES41_11838 [Pseudorhodoferax soli]|uniref:Uncharacterized protein n=1 Tax=Pseudorhodoferax soli TaxID=545864 RepID=A0A368X6M1_9BURK|nr:hypothetical protein DES41_11838 [Pseudorhodoferax soli]
MGGCRHLSTKGEDWTVPVGSAGRAARAACTKFNAHGTQTVFEFANPVAGAPFYAVETYSESGGDVRASFGDG